MSLAFLCVTTSRRRPPLLLSPPTHLYSIVFISYILIIFIKSSVSISDGDVCRLENHSMFCNCDEDEPNQAKTINCFIFSPSALSLKSSVWQTFKRQRNTTTLVFNCAEKNPINFIPLTGLRATLKVLKNFKQIGGNLSVIPTNGFAGFQSLRKLELDRNNIAKLEEDAFSGPAALQVLSLSQNSLQSVTRTSFKGLTELKELNLDRNRIIHIQNNSFESLTKLTILTLWSNLISDLNVNTFAGLSSLQHLDLFRNRITRIPSNLFEKTPEIEELDLKENLIEIIEAGAFEGLLNLQTIRLNKNRLTTLDSPLFVDSTRLRLIEFSSNKLQTMSEDVIYGLEQVTSLFFAVKLQDNPWICSCEILWMAHLVPKVKNELLMRELNTTECTVLKPIGEVKQNKASIIEFAAHSSVVEYCKTEKKKVDKEKMQQTAAEIQSSKSKRISYKLWSHTVGKGNLTSSEKLGAPNSSTTMHTSQPLIPLLILLFSHSHFP